MIRYTLRRNALLNETNALVSPAVCQVSTVSIVPTDQWVRGRCADFEDGIHHQSLNFGHIFSILHDLCVHRG